MFETLIYLVEWSSVNSFLKGWLGVGEGWEDGLRYVREGYVL